MKTNILKPSASTALALALALALSGAGPTQAQACLDKLQAQEALLSGQIISLAAAMDAAGVDRNAEPLSVQVCDNGGRLVYIVDLMSPDGQTRTETLSAQ